MPSLRRAASRNEPLAPLLVCVGEGSGVRSASPPKISPNQRQHRRQITLNLFSSHTNNPNAKRLDDFLSESIGFLLTFMNQAVNLNHKAFIRAIEINHECANWILPPEFAPIKLSIA